MLPVAIALLSVPEKSPAAEHVGGLGPQGQRALCPAYKISDGTYSDVEFCITRSLFGL